MSSEFLPSLFVQETNIAPFTASSHRVYIVFQAQYTTLPSGFRLTWSSWKNVHHTHAQLLTDVLINVLKVIACCAFIFWSNVNSKYILSFSVLINMIQEELQAG